MRTKIIFTVSLIIALLASGLGVLKYQQHVNSRELIVLNSKYQDEWRAIDTNMESFNNVTKLLAEGYAKESSNKSLFSEATENSKRYNESLNKLDKFKLYKANVKIYKEIKGLVSKNEELLNVELIKESLSNAEPISKSIEEQVKSYNDLITEYNSIVKSLRMKGTNSQDLLK